MKSKTLAVSALTAVLMATAPALAQTSMGAAGASKTAPSGATNASVAGAAKVPVANIPNPEQIRGAPVLDSSGKAFGRVIGVKTGSDGKADRVKVALTTQAGLGRAASIRADRLTLDPSKQAIVADLSPSEVVQLASTASSIGPGTAGSSASGGGPAGGSSGGGKGNY